MSTINLTCLTLNSQADFYYTFLNCHFSNFEYETRGQTRACDELDYGIKNSGEQGATNLREKINSSRKRRFLATEITISLQVAVFVAVILQPMWAVT
jgi:hypothetical protein